MFLAPKPPKEIHLLSSYICKGLEATSDYPEDVKAHMSSIRGGELLSDIIANRNFLLVVSQVVKSAIESVSVNKIEYLPLSILNHKGNIASKDYFYINPIGSYDCLHCQLFEIEYLKETKKVVGVDKYVLDPNKLMDVPHIFRIAETPKKYVVSQVLVDHIKNLKPQVTNLVLKKNK